MNGIRLSFLSDWTPGQLEYGSIYFLLQQRFKPEYTAQSLRGVWIFLAMVHYYGMVHYYRGHSYYNTVCVSLNHQ